MRPRDDDFLDEMEKRVRKVWHLDPVEFSVRKDGRFRCVLKKPPDELSREEALRLVRALEPVVEKLRERAEAAPD